MLTVDERGEVAALGRRFVTSLAQQDWAGLEGCFDPGVQFRALIPPGLREAQDDAGVAGYLKRWFGDADQIVALDSRIELIEDRLAIRYRLRVHEDQWYGVEQTAYCTVSDGRIERMDLVCSGFRPEAVSAGGGSPD